MDAAQVKETMAGKQGAALQQYNNELVKCLDELSRRRRTLQVNFSAIVLLFHYFNHWWNIFSQNEIDRDEAEKQKLEAEVAAARERLEVVENRLALKTTRMENYDKAIVKSEAAYLQILESSQVTKSRAIGFHG